MKQEVVGVRAVIEVGKSSGGWGWWCRACERHAGLSKNPFTDQYITYRINDNADEITIWMTGEQQALSAARMHSNKVCAP